MYVFAALAGHLEANGVQGEVFPTTIAPGRVGSWSRNRLQSRLTVILTELGLYLYLTAHNPSHVRGPRIHTLPNNPPTSSMASSGTSSCMV